MNPWARHWRKHLPHAQHAAHLLLVGATCSSEGSPQPVAQSDRQLLSQRLAERGLACPRRPASQAIPAAVVFTRTKPRLCTHGILLCRLRHLWPQPPCGTISMPESSLPTCRLGPAVAGAHAPAAHDTIPAANPHPAALPLAAAPRRCPPVQQHDPVPADELRVDTALREEQRRRGVAQQALLHLALVVLQDQQAVGRRHQRARKTPGGQARARTSRRASSQATGLPGEL